jgi:hypothetical protein
MKRVLPPRTDQGSKLPLGEASAERLGGGHCPVLIVEDLLQRRWWRGWNLHVAYGA